MTALESVGFPAAVLNYSSKVVAANRLFEEFGSRLRIGCRNRLSLANPRVQSHFVDAIATNRPEMDSACPLSFPIQSDGEHPPGVLHLLPIRGAGRDVFGNASFLVYVTTLSSRVALPTSILQALFDLTPAESRIAAAIGSGSSVAAAALRHRVDRNTVRAHLKAVFAKTGARRQADLVGLVTTVSPAAQAL